MNAPPDLAAEHEISVVVPVYGGERTSRAWSRSSRRTPRQQCRSAPLPRHRGPARPRPRPGRLGAGDARPRGRYDFVRAIWLSRNFGQHRRDAGRDGLPPAATGSSPWTRTASTTPGASALLDIALAEQVAVVYARPTNGPRTAWLRNLASRGAKRLSGCGRRRHRVPELPAGAGRGRAQRRGVRRLRRLPRRRPRLGRRRPPPCPVACAARATRPPATPPGALLSHFWRMVLTGGTRGLRLVSVLGVRSPWSACAGGVTSCRSGVRRRRRPGLDVPMVVTADLHAARSCSRSA